MKSMKRSRSSTAYVEPSFNAILEVAKTHRALIEAALRSSGQVRFDDMTVNGVAVHMVKGGQIINKGQLLDPEVAVRAMQNGVLWDDERGQ